ncbi:hypothetical protein ACLOJK_011506 [Asimina triloba]
MIDTGMISTHAVSIIKINEGRVCSSLIFSSSPHRGARIHFPADSKSEKPLYYKSLREIEVCNIDLYNGDNEDGEFEAKMEMSNLTWEDFGSEIMSMLIIE